MPGDNLILAGSGDDSVLAGFGTDTVFGEAGDDTIFGFGAAGVSPVGSAGIISADGPDWLFGGRGNDSMLGGGGNDLLDGGTGKDTLGGGVGADTLIGGAGPDVFLYGLGLEPGVSGFATGRDTGVGPGNRDIILDFHRGQDLLDLSNYRPFSPGPGEQQPPSLFLGTAPFEDVIALQVRYDIQGGNTVVQFYGPIGPLFSLPPPSGEIELAGVHYLGAEDFILT
jgi:Ca2+-binding RTX toxin-like protein